MTGWGAALLFVGIGAVILVWHEVCARRGTPVPAVVSWVGLFWMLLCGALLLIVQTKVRW